MLSSCRSIFNFHIESKDFPFNFWLLVPVLGWSRELLLLLLILQDKVAWRFRALPLFLLLNFFSFNWSFIDWGIDVCFETCTLIWEELHVWIVYEALIVFLLNHFLSLESIISRGGWHRSLSPSLNCYWLRKGGRSQL